MLKEIINDVVETIASNFTNCTVYVGNTEKNIKRPSFLVSYKESTIEALNLWTYRDNMIIQIIYFAPLNNNVPDAMEQYSVYDKLNKLFAQGFITVKDRKIKINKITGGNNDYFIKELIGETGYREIFIKLYLDVPECREEQLNYGDNNETSKSIEFKLQEV
ncbi:phage tail terminator family protein [Clostridium tagluense]|uniref:phage tail terminator family protein n=1 Tax=Clostridium tagluense TaxID=360422 RepID=UPI001C6E306F|nr:hypothetical protein [Clostridium tagluense]MBW9159348.1 hypothetical protein [Clostridium tagluense]WLC68077.1 hypothetical protein KTC93_24180 [Clostridium tagluense]